MFGAVMYLYVRCNTRKCMSAASVACHARVGVTATRNVIETAHVAGAYVVCSDAAVQLALHVPSPVGAHVGAYTSRGA